MGKIQTIAEALLALDEFNGFHDAFIRKLAIYSHDQFESRGVQNLSGRLDLEITFAHYNYRDGLPPASQLVVARFFEARSIEIAFSGLAHEWSVNFLQIRPETRTAYQATEPCLLVTLAQNHLVNNQTWELREDLRFTAAQVEFLEL